jgi:plastocyanin
MRWRRSIIRSIAPEPETTMTHRFLPRAHSSALSLLFALCVAGRADAAATQTVEIDKFAFSPKEITVAPGTTVVWTNHDQTPHILLATDKSFFSPAMDTGDSYRFTFTKAGDFGYFCTMHPFMTGIVHVRK